MFDARDAWTDKDGAALLSSLYEFNMPVLSLVSSPTFPLDLILGNLIVIH